MLTDSLNSLLVCNILPHPVEFLPTYLLALTLYGLSSAALNESNANKLTRYSAANRIAISANPPFPVISLCSPANAPSPTVWLGWLELPNVLPFDENAADPAPPAPVSFAALRTAAVSADGLAPRIVSITDLDLITRKVGML